MAVSLVCARSHLLVQDDVWRSAVALVVHDIGEAEHAALSEGPLGQLRGEQLVARAALLAVAAHRGPEELIGEQVQRAGEDGARVVSRLHSADDEENEEEILEEIVGKEIVIDEDS